MKNGAPKIRAPFFYFRFHLKLPCASVWLLPFLGLLFFNYNLSCSQARDRYAERRGADVVQADLMAELDAVGVATVFSADADLQFAASPAALFSAPLHQHADALLVEGLERVSREDASLLFVDIVGKKAARVVTREAHSRLC